MRRSAMEYVKLSLDSTFNFRCVRCDYCCGTGPNVTITGYDVIRLSMYRGIHWMEFLKLYTNVIVADIIPVISLAGVGKGRCPFLRFKSTTTYCSVYKARPLKCRLYPLVLNSTKPSAVYLDLKCPGVGIGVAKIPINLIKHYAWELRSYYSLLLDLILARGSNSLDALYGAMRLLREEADKEPKWLDLDYIESLGRT